MNIQPNSSADQTSKDPAWLGLAISGGIGALAGSLIVHSIHPAFTLPEAFSVMPESPSADLLAEYKAAYLNMSIGNASTAFAIVGACLGLSVGFWGGAKSRIASALKTLISAGVAGAAAGAAGGFLVANGAFLEGRAALPIYNLDPMLLSVLIQFVGWGAIGIGMGMALTCCRPGARILEGATWGLAGGFLAAVMHAVSSSIAFPTSELMQAVPSTFVERLTWAGGAGICLGLCMIPLIRANPKTVAPILDPAA